MTVFALKILIVILAAALLIMLKAWANAERYASYYYKKYHGSEYYSLYSKPPQISRTRKILFFLFKIKNPKS